MLTLNIAVPMHALANMAFRLPPNSSCEIQAGGSVHSC